MFLCLLTLGQYAEYIYGIADPDVKPATGQDVGDDIESSIQKEINSMAGKQGPAKLFMPVYLDLQCVLFFKTRPPIIPVDFVQRICEDARSQEAKRRVRFVNRLTPMTMIAKATEKGLEDVGKMVLREHFELAGKERHVDPEREIKHYSVSVSHFFRCSWMIFHYYVTIMALLEPRRHTRSKRCHCIELNKCRDLTTDTSMAPFHY